MSVQMNVEYNYYFLKTVYIKKSNKKHLKKTWLVITFRDNIVS